jgi:hypothetical protein
MVSPESHTTGTQIETSNQYLTLELLACGGQSGVGLGYLEKKKCNKQRTQEECVDNLIQLLENDERNAALLASQGRN